MVNESDNNKPEEIQDKDTVEVSQTVTEQEPVEAQDLSAKEDDSETTSERDGEESQESLMDLYEESFKRFAEGEVVTGKIIAIDKDYVLVDIGY